MVTATPLPKLLKLSLLLFIGALHSGPESVVVIVSQLVEHIAELLLERDSEDILLLLVSTEL